MSVAKILRKARFAGALGSLLDRWNRDDKLEQQFLSDVSATWEHAPNWPTVTPERARELHSMPYRSYLETPEWRLRSTDVRTRAGWRCAACGSETRLQVHHMSYRRRGYERPSDLVALCNACHKLIHHKQTSDSRPG